MRATSGGEGTSPGEGPALAAVFGAALPDLIDKPIWFVGVVDVGRTIGHSLLFAVPLVVLAWAVARSRGRELLGVAFAIGYLSRRDGRPLARTLR